MAEYIGKQYSCGVTEAEGAAYHEDGSVLA